jgi:plasmid maintenance system antidote protein VapI
MTPNQLRTALARLGLSQRAAARLLGINERTMRKYIAGDLVIPELLVWALRGLAEREQEQMRLREELDLVRRQIDGE